MKNMVTDLTNQFPELTPNQKRRVLVGVRPLRKDHIRLQRQQINGKIIVHNYGHGGSGVTLAPALSEEAVNLIIKQVKIGEQVTVLGCGISGLMTAIGCVRKGLKVSIYAGRIPKPKETKVGQMITSEIAPGYWLPSFYEYPDQKIHESRCQFAYNQYTLWMKKVKSIRKVRVYDHFTIDQLKRIAPPIVETCKPVTLKIGKGQFDVISFETFQIHLQNFLQQLIQICKSNGVKFYDHKFNKIDDIYKVKAKVIVNCMGLGSKKIFGDEKLEGLKGYLIEFNNSTKIKGNFSFKWMNEWVKLYCFDQKILVGLTKQNIQDVQIVDQVVNNLETRIYSFYNSLKLVPIKPKL